MKCSLHAGSDCENRWRLDELSAQESPDSDCIVHGRNVPGAVSFQSSEQQDDWPDERPEAFQIAEQLKQEGRVVSLICGSCARPVLESTASARAVKTCQSHDMFFAVACNGSAALPAWCLRFFSFFSPENQAAKKTA